MIFFEGLGEKVVGPFLHGVDGGADRAVGSHDDDRQSFRVLRPVQLFQHIEAGEFRQRQVQQHEMGRLLRDLLQRLPPVPRSHCAIAEGVQPVFQHCDDIGIVIDNQYFGGHVLTPLAYPSMTLMTSPVGGFG
jgi:hypothetical protein